MVIVSTLFGVFGASDEGRSAEVDGVHLPNTLAVSGIEVTLFGCGFREVLWVDLYLVSLYLEDRPRTNAAIRSDAEAKALRVDIVFDGAIPEELPADWRATLREELSRDMFRVFRDLYADLVIGDSLIVSYAPTDAVSRVRLNGDLVAERDGHELIDALLDLWIGREPIPRNLRRLLLTGAC